MNPITTVEGKAYPFGRKNVDTDVIIPARYLNTSNAAELAAHCMEDIDPDFLKNVREGHPEDTLECLACNQGCIERLSLEALPIRCAINPQTGQELLYPASPAAVSRNVALLEKNLRISKEGGAEFHDIMLHIRHARGTVLTDDDIVSFYELAHELGERIGIEVGLENHIYMWSEDPRRITPIARKVQARGLPFKYVLDHSHVLIKVDNVEEQDIIGIRADVENGSLLIDPYESGNVLDEWIGMNMVHWLQVRPVSPNGPKNRWAIKNNNSYDGGAYGRPCQYPFVKPKAGEWHSQWHAYRVEPCKEVVRKAFRHHITTPDSPLRYITTDMIDMADYGENARYSLFEQNVAIASWLRSTWDDMVAEATLKTGP